MKRPLTIDVRAGGGRENSLKLLSSNIPDPAELVGRCLAELNEPVAFLEVKRDDPRAWDEWAADDSVFEVLRVGISGERGAAEYIRGGFRNGRYEFDAAKATLSPSPVVAAPNVLYDICVPLYFPRWTLISAADARETMIHYAATGELTDVVAWCDLDELVGTEDPAAPRAA